MTEQSLTTIEGRCHCGNIRFDFDWPSDRTEIPARTCTCDFCLKHGGRWTSNPEGRVKLCVADSTRVAIYRFGTNTADFHICATCGVVPIVSCELEGKRFAVVNVNTFVNIPPDRLRPTPINFEAEKLESRLSRRRRSWTPVG